jgi:hypothetical protein
MAHFYKTLWRHHDFDCIHTNCYFVPCTLCTPTCSSSSSRLWTLIPLTARTVLEFLKCYSAYCIWLFYTNHTQVTFTVSLTSLVVIILNTMDITTVSPDEILQQNDYPGVSLIHTQECYMFSTQTKFSKWGCILTTISAWHRFAIRLCLFCQSELHTEQAGSNVNAFDLNFIGTRFECRLGNQVYWVFSWFPSALPGKCHDSPLNHTMTTFFPFLCSTSLPDTKQ